MPPRSSARTTRTTGNQRRPAAASQAPSSATVGRSAGPQARRSAAPRGGQTKLNFEGTSRMGARSGGGANEVDEIEDDDDDDDDAFDPLPTSSRR